jgi:hypothetical protein
VSALATLLAKIEIAIDAEPSLTRAHRGHGGKFIESPELVFSRDGWTARCKLRGVGAKGRGTRLMTDVHGDGETPELAVAALIESLTIWKEVLK